MKELINNLLEKYVYYKPVTIEDFDIHNEELANRKFKVHAGSESIFDPNFGFSEPRRPRVVKAQPIEIFSAKVPDSKRDYCADHYIRWKACKTEYPLSFFKCYHYREETAACQVEDAVLNQKEWERERRLMLRNKRIKRMELGLES